MVCFSLSFLFPFSLSLFSSQLFSGDSAHLNPSWFFLTLVFFFVCVFLLSLISLIRLCTFVRVGAADLLRPSPNSRDEEQFRCTKSSQERSLRECNSGSFSACMAKQEQSTNLSEKSASSFSFLTLPPPSLSSGIKLQRCVFLVCLFFSFPSQRRSAQHY